MVIKGTATSADGRKSFIIKYEPLIGMWLKELDRFNDWFQVPPIRIEEIDGSVCLLVDSNDLDCFVWMTRDMKLLDSVINLEFEEVGR